MLTEEKRKQGEEAVRKLLSCFNVDTEERGGMFTLVEKPKRSNRRKTKRERENESMGSLF